MRARLLVETSMAVNFTKSFPNGFNVDGDGHVTVAETLMFWATTTVGAQDLLIKDNTLVVDGAILTHWLQVWNGCWSFGLSINFLYDGTKFVIKTF